MGWDAYATMPDGRWVYDHGKREWLMPEAKKAFEAAVERVMARTGSADGALRHGGLDVSDCGEWLGLICGGDDEAAWSRKPWSPEDLAAGVWLEDGDEMAEPWAYWSAREFAETCVKLGLGVEFRW